MKTKTYSLVIIILLLVIFVPLTIFGYVYNKKNQVEENPNHDLFYEGKLYFYNDNNELINKYECKGKCELAKSNLENDIKYNINYYKEGIDTNIPVINNTFAFIQDGDIVYLYEIEHNLIMHEYASVNNYNTKIENDLYILKDNDNYGVISITDTINIIIPFEYSFIGLKNFLDDNMLRSNVFIVSKNNSWYLINNEGKDVTAKFENPIIDYNNSYVIINNNSYEIYDYKGVRYLENINIEKCISTSKYLGIITNNTLYIYDDLNKEYIKEVKINNIDSVSFKEEDSKINIMENEEVIDSI